MGAAPGLVCSAPPSPPSLLNVAPEVSRLCTVETWALRQRRGAGISHLGWVPGIKGAGYWSLGRYTRTTWHYNLQGHVQNIASAGCGPASTSTQKTTTKTAQIQQQQHQHVRFPEKGRVARVESAGCVNGLAGQCSSETAVLLHRSALHLCHFPCPSCGA